MKKNIVFLFHFLGGVYFAIFLIAFTACVIMLGTAIESYTGSHALAAIWTYEHPLFFTLLILFFINILFSALRRWPFKRQHLPFLLTHWGLLMIIGGTMIKNSIGLQGILSVCEGSANNRVVLPSTYALLIEKGDKQGQTSSREILLPSLLPQVYYPDHFPGLQCRVIGYAPHVQEKYMNGMKRREIIPEKPPRNKEEHRPGIVLEVSEDGKTETIALAYDPTFQNYKWPLLHGKYVVRFQPQQKEIPYRIRLRQARQNFYPHSTKTYSYESDVWIIAKNQPAIPHTLSMNNVYESWDGYRFYLAGIGKWLHTDIPCVQFAVNHDPAKYWLTYPGALFVCIGSALLLFFRNQTFRQKIGPLQTMP